VHRGLLTIDSRAVGRIRSSVGGTCRMLISTVPPWETGHRPVWSC